ISPDVPHPRLLSARSVPIGRRSDAARPEQAAPISVAAMQALVQSMETKHGPSQENRLCVDGGDDRDDPDCGLRGRSEEHTSELQSLMRLSYAVFCLKNK